MKTLLSFGPIALALMLLAFSPATAPAQIQVRLSVKFIKNADGTRPSGGRDGFDADISTVSGFSGEIARGNQVLRETWRGYQLAVVEYLDIQPAAPPLFPPDYWFNLDARQNRSTIESAAIVDSAWRWNPDAVNIYVNNSASGQCSFVGTGDAISLGGSIRTGTVLHELGHLFDLRHTHPGDENCRTFTPTPPLSQYLGDGDGLDATILDHNCFSRDQLSMANFNANYDGLSDAQKEAVNTSWLNVMSYHQEDQLLDVQMDTWASRANIPRRGFCSGRTWFVDPRGNCASRLGGVSCNGIDGGPYKTVTEAVNSANPNGGDIVMLRPLSYNERFTRLNKPVTFRATQEGPATIGR